MTVEINEKIEALVKGITDLGETPVYAGCLDGYDPTKSDEIGRMKLIDVIGFITDEELESGDNYCTAITSDIINALKVHFNK